MNMLNGKELNSVDVMLLQYALEEFGNRLFGSNNSGIIKLTENEVSLIENALRQYQSTLSDDDQDKCIDLMEKITLKHNGSISVLSIQRNSATNDNAIKLNNEA